MNIMGLDGNQLQNTFEKLNSDVSFMTCFLRITLRPCCEQFNVGTIFCRSYSASM